MELQSRDFKAHFPRLWSTVPATRLDADAREEFENKRRSCTYAGDINSYKHPCTGEKLFPTKHNI